VSSETVAARAAVLREPGRPVEIETIRLDPPRVGEVQVRVAAAGVCHSDVHLADGVLGRDRWPMVLGHEGAGIVEAVAPDVTHVQPGDPVAFCFVPSCGRCAPCRAGRTTLCEVAGANLVRGTLMDGTSRLHDAHGETLQHGLMVACFSERVVIDGASAVPLPAALPLWQAALLGCAVVTGVGAVRNVARVRIGETACVVGCGGVGLQVISGLVLSGASRIIAVDRDSSKLELALARGATDGVLASSIAAAEVRRLAGGVGVDHAFEVVGRGETIRVAWDALRPGGSAVVVGLAPRGVEVCVPAIEFLSDKSLRGCFYGSGHVAAELPGLAELALAGRIDLAGAVSRLSPLDDVQEALDRLRRGEGARTVLVLDEDLAGVQVSQAGAA
jgi:S-(hydroxymethyl)glutathione dehydrogenase / alcohol dehydrogenase